MNDENKKSNTKNAKSLYSTVISYLNCEEEYEFNNFSFRNYLGTKTSGTDKPNIKDIVGKDAYQKIKPYLDKALSGEEQQFEFEWQLTAGAPPHLYNVIYTPDIDDDGNVIGIHIVSNDVSAEQHKKLLKESEERLQFAMDATGGGVWDWNIKTGEVTFSEKWYQSLGYEVDEIDQNLKFWKQILHPDDEESTVNKVNAYVENKTETYVHENRLKKRSGKYRHNLARGRVVEWDEEGNPLRMVGIDTDISEIKWTEEKLRESDERFKAAFDDATIGMAWVSLNHSVIKANQSLLNILGYSAKELEGVLFKDITHPEDVSKSLECHDKLITGKIDNYKIEKRYFHKQGHEINALLCVSLVRGKDATPLYAIAQIQDITVRKQLEKTRNLYLLFLENLERIDRAIQQTTDVERMMSDVLQETLEIFNTDRTWLIYPCDPEAESWSVCVRQTRPEYPGVYALNEEIPMQADIADEFCKALNMNNVASIDYQNLEKDSPKNSPLQNSSLSQLHMPIHPQVGNAWLFGMHQCSHNRQWTDDEKDLFREIGRRINDALSGLLFLRELQQSEERLRISQLYGNIGTWEADLISNREFWSEAVTSKLGFPRIAEPTWDDYIATIYPEDRDHVIAEVNRHIDAGNECDIEYRIIDTEEKIRWMRSIGKAEFDSNNKPVRMRGTVQDVTKQKQNELLLKESEARLQLALDAIGDGVWDWNIKTGDVIFSDKWCRSLGYEPEKIDANIKFWKQILHPDDEVATVDRVKKHFDNKAETYIHENRIRKHSGEYRYNLSQGRIVEWDEKGMPLRMIGTDTDISTVKHTEYELNEKLNYQASHDSLTGLINRSEFERRTDQLLKTSKQNATEHVLCFMDLDQFKVVNDTCGHGAGDKLLHELSILLQKKVRKNDTLARLGGDEFGLLMKQCSVEQARRVAKSIQKTIQDYQFSWKGHLFKLGVSMGLVSITEVTQNLTTLLRDADIACHMAKEHGRNRIHVYHADDSETIQHHGNMQWVERINRALKEDLFCLYAQSIMPLGDNNDVHYELLVRMKDDKGNIILPGEFLPTAERYNLITKLDCWVIKQAFKLLLENPVFLKQVNFISINLSGQSFADETFSNFVVTQLQESGIDGGKICFEITETAAISNLDEADKFIAELRQYGCRFALDDFGSGLSSFAYLKNLPVDYLKIDGMFVKDIANDPIDHAMVKSINEIGQVMGMQTIAEFVEKDETKGMLKAIGVNHAQGFGIGKPLAFDELLGRSNNVSNMEQTGKN